MIEPFQSRDKACEFDYITLALTGGRSGLVCLSEQTWELCYNLLTFYGYWRSRYYFTDQTTGERRELTDSEYTQVTDWVDQGIEELRMTGCDDLTNAIRALTDAVKTQQLVNLCCPESVGSQIDDDPLDDSDAPIGPGEQFPTQGEYDEAKCNVANWIVDNLIELVSEFRSLDIDTLAAGGVGLTTSIVIALLTANPIGLSASIVIAIVSGFVSLILSAVSFDLVDLEDALTDNAEDIKQALYCATTITEANDAFNDALTGEGLTSVETGFLNLILTNTTLNQLFVPSSDAGDWDGAYECDSCGAECLPVYIVADGLGGPGEVNDLGGGDLELVGELAGDGRYRVGIRFNWLADDSTCCGDMVDVSYVSGDSSFESGLGCRYFQDDGDCDTQALGYSDANFFGGSPTIRGLFLRSTVPFTTVINVS